MGSDGGFSASLREDLAGSANTSNGDISHGHHGDDDCIGPPPRLMHRSSSWSVRSLAIGRLGSSSRSLERGVQHIKPGPPK